MIEVERDKEKEGRQDDRVEQDKLRTQGLCVACSSVVGRSFGAGSLYCVICCEAGMDGRCCVWIAGG